MPLDSGRCIYNEIYNLEQKKIDNPEQYMEPNPMAPVRKALIPYRLQSRHSAKVIKDPVP
jgi:hypothetical protein